MGAGSQQPVRPYTRQLFYGIARAGPDGPYDKIDKCELTYAFEHIFRHQEILQTQEVISWTQEIVISLQDLADSIK